MRALAIVVATIGLLISGCATAETTSGRPAVTGAPVYRLGPDDKLRISVYGEEALAGEFPIGSDGYISFPLIGRIKAGGLTLDEFQTSLTAALSQGLLQNPRVSVDVATYRPFYIMGEVNKPGQYPYVTGLTVMSAVATAQGYTFRANKKRVYIKHANEADENLYKLDPNTPVMPGDTIRIVERFF